MLATFPDFERSVS